MLSKIFMSMLRAMLFSKQRTSHGRQRSPSPWGDRRNIYRSRVTGGNGDRNFSTPNSTRVNKGVRDGASLKCFCFQCFDAGCRLWLLSGWTSAVVSQMSCLDISITAKSGARIGTWRRPHTWPQLRSPAGEHSRRSATGTPNRSRPPRSE